MTPKIDDKMLKKTIEIDFPMREFSDDDRLVDKKFKVGNFYW